MTDLFFDILDIEDERKENLKDDFLFFFFSLNIPMHYGAIY